MDRWFTPFANAVAHAAGTPVAFFAAVAVVVIWATSGPIFSYSETWQLVINTGTTIVTFLMVFVIQNSQNRDNAALQAKLDELIRASDAEDEFMGIEKLTDTELETLHKRCAAMAEKSQAMLKKTTEHRSKRQASRALDRSGQCD